MQFPDQSINLIIASSIFMVVCPVMVGTRTWVRWEQKSFGVDDILLLVGLALYIISTAFVYPAVHNGLGMHAGHYTDAQYTVAVKWFIFFQDFYVWECIPIKVSLCFSLLRITTQKWTRWFIYFLMFVATGSSVGANLFILTSCTPTRALWNPNILGAHCRPASETTQLGTGYSVIGIFLDWCLALLPVLLLWNIQMKWRLKATAMVILGLGILASCATIVRFKTLQGFTNVDDYLFGIGQITVWTVIEVGLGLVTASLITFRPLMRKLFGTFFSESSSNNAHGRGSHAPPYVTHTSSRRRHDWTDPTGELADGIGMDTVILSKDNKAANVDIRDDSSQSSLVFGHNDAAIKVTKTFNFS